MATVAFAYSNPSALGGAIRPTPDGSAWLFSVVVGYKDSDTGLKQVDVVEVTLQDNQLSSLAALKSNLAQGIKAWLIANKGITPTNVIVEEWANIPV